MFDGEGVLRLPKSSVPISYDLSLNTSIHSGLRAFSGVVKIDIKITEKTDMLTLHSKELSIEHVKLTNQQTQDVYKVQYTTDWVKDLVYIESLVRPLNIGEFFSIEIKYWGNLKTSTNGFYRSSYKVNDVTR